MFAHCQLPSKQKRHAYRPTSFDEYLDFRIAHPKNKTLCGYSPLNIQVSRLGGGPDQLQAALDVLSSAFWVGVTGRYDASICLLRSKLSGKAACSCQNLTSGHVDIHIDYGTQPDGITLTSTMRRQISFLSGLDEILHARALSMLQQELARFNLSCLLQTTE